MNKFLSVIFFIAIICSASHSFSGAITDSVFSGATLTSLNDITASSKGSVPVGTVIVWPVANDPEDMTNSDGTVNWLECNGQTFNTTTYSSLANIVGTKTPNYQGMFLRGNGSQDYAQNNGSTVGVTSTTYSSGQLGQVQGDALRQLYGKFNYNDGTGFGWRGFVEGALCEGDIFSSSVPGNAPVSSKGIRFDSSQILSTAPENRPVNMAVRYLIRALP